MLCASLRWKGHEVFAMHLAFVQHLLTLHREYQSGSVQEYKIWPSHKWVLICSVKALHQVLKCMHGRRTNALRKKKRCISPISIYRNMTKKSWRVYQLKKEKLPTHVVFRNTSRSYFKLAVRPKRKVTQVAWIQFHFYFILFMFKCQEQFYNFLVPGCGL